MQNIAIQVQDFMQYVNNHSQNMQIKLDRKFEINFNIIFEYIAKDKLSASKKFKKELFEQIKNLPNFPYKFRKSYYFDDEKVRDMTFKSIWNTKFT